MQSLLRLMRQLNRELNAKDTEIMRLKSQMGYMRVEDEVKSRTAQEKYDELHARYLALEEKCEMAEEKAKETEKARQKTEAKARRAAEKHAKIAKEHAEFAAEARVEFLLGKFPEYRERCGTNSTQYLDMLDELRQISTRHPTVFVERPQLRAIVESLGEASNPVNLNPSPEEALRPRPAGEAPRPEVHPPATIDQEREREFHRQEREAAARKGRGRQSSSTSRARETRATRGRGAAGNKGKGKLCMDDVLTISSRRNRKSGEE